MYLSELLLDAAAAVGLFFVVPFVPSSLVLASTFVCVRVLLAGVSDWHSPQLHQQTWSLNRGLEVQSRHNRLD